jgi:hypothetical protein
MWKHGGCAIYKPEYHSWYAMTQRSLNPKNMNYEDYGGRGVKVCAQWLGRAGFLKFIDDLGRRPEGKTLDRINVMGNYEPGNVRWSDAKTQSFNRRRNKTPEELEELQRVAEMEERLKADDYYGGEAAY